MKIGRLILVLLLLAAGFVLGHGYGRWYAVESAPAKPAETAAPYYCPMHPNFTSEYETDCPICGMRLVRRKTNGVAGTAAPGAAPPDSTFAPGTIHVSPEKQQLIGVSYALAEYLPSVQEIRATGKVAIDETRLSRVQTRVDGWIEDVMVDFTGKLVTKGQPMLTLYSPEMLATQQEYLLALRSRKVLEQSPLESARLHSAPLIEAARRRLELLGLSAEHIQQLEQGGQPRRDLTVYAPMSGFVLARNAFPKQRVTAETELYTLADLSRVWIFADVYESDASFMRVGLPASITLTYSGGRRLAARVTNIQPQVDPTSRTLKVRLEADNPGFALKPEMFVEVDFRIASPARVMVPAGAVLDTGAQQTVFLDRGEGHLEPRPVKVGARVGGNVEILSGLRPGERVVASGAFLIDSESRLHSAAPAPAADSAQPAPPPRQEHRHD